MSAAGAKRAVNGEIAAICACALVSRLDWDQPRHAILLERALLLERRLPPEAGLLTQAAFTRLGFKLHQYAAALEGIVRLPTGERDLRGLIHLQGDLRACVDGCLAALGDRCFATWSGLGGADAPSIDDRTPAPDDEAGAPAAPGGT